MSQVRFLRNMVGVEPAKKSTKKEDSLFVIPENVYNYGTVRYMGTDVRGLNVGDKVFYGTKREEVRIHGSEILLMEDTNVFGVEDQETPSQS